MKHQFSVSHVSSHQTKIQWATEANENQQVIFLLKHQNDPISIEATLTTPWSPLKHIETSLIWDPAGASRKFLISSKESEDRVNARVQLTVSGNSQDFLHEVDGEWFSNTMRVTVSGGLNGYADSNLHTLFKFPDHHYSFDLLSKKETDKYIGEFKADLNNAVTTGGVKWDFTSDVTSQKVASVWAQVPKFPPVSATMEYDGTGSKRTVQVKITKKDNEVIDLVSVVQFTGARYWDTDLVLKSTLSYIPSISLSSKHNMVDIRKIQHLTKLTLVPLHEDDFWLNNYNISVRHISADLKVDNLEDVRGTVILGQTDFTVTGKIETLAHDYTVTGQISSNAFHQVNYQGSYHNQDGVLTATGRISSREDEILLKGQLELKRLATEQAAKVEFESTYTPTLEAYAGLRTVQGLEFSSYLLKDSMNLVKFSAKSLVSPSLGNVHGQLTSSYFPSIKHLQLDLDYKFSGTEVTSGVVFQDNEMVHAASIEGIWGEPSKRAKMSYNGPRTSFSVEGVLEGMQQLRAYTVYDGRKLGEISISYRPEQGDYSYGKHGVYLTFINGEEVAQNVNVIVGLDSTKIFTNVQTPIENWTDILITGEVASTLTSKGIKFLLKRESESIQGSFESRNSKKTGNLQITSELSVDGFTKLRRIILETAQATEIQGLSAVKPQKFQFKLNWATTNFNLKVDTPVDVLKTLILAGNWEFKKPQRFINLSGQINDRNFDLKTHVELEGESLKGKLSFATNDPYSIEVGCDFTDNYETSLTVETPNQQWNLGGKLSIQENSIGVRLITPIRNFESMELTARRESWNPNQGLYSISWDVKGYADKIELKYEVEQGRVELRGITPFEPWTSVVVTVIYDTPFKHLTFHSQRGDGQEVRLNFEIDYAGNLTDFGNPASSKILVSVETPVENFKDIQFSLLYDRKNLAHSANLSITRNAGTTEGTLSLKFQHNDPVALNISAFLTSPTLNSKATAHASLLVDPSGESTISAHVQTNGRRYEMYGLSQFTNALTKFEMRTSLPFLRQLRFSIRKGTSMNVFGIWTGSNKQVEVHGDVLCGGLHKSKITFNVSTPVEFMGSFGFDGEISTKPEGTSAALVFQNHQVRWLAKLDKLKETGGAEDWRLQVNTPLVGYKHVVISLKHQVTATESSIVSSISLNKKDISMKLNLKRKQLNMVLASELAYLPVQATIDSDWGSDWILKIATNTGTNEYGTSFNMNLHGVSDGNLDFATSSMQHLSTRLDWKFEGDSGKGRGLINIKNQLVGAKSLRSSWENLDNWQKVTAGIWMKAGSEQREKGLTLEYQVTPHTNYGSIVATVNYTLTEATKSIVFEGSLDEQSSNLSFDSVLRTPFEDFQLFETKGQLSMKNEITCKLESRVNGDTIVDGSLSLFVKPGRGGLAAMLDIPFVLSDRFELDASYDTTAEEKFILASFKQNVYLMDLRFEVTIPRNGNLIDVQLAVESTVPSIPVEVAGNFRAEYEVGTDGTRQASFHLKGDQVGDWKLLLTLQTTNDIHSKVIFEAPTWLLPTLMAEFNLKGGLPANVTSDVTIIVGSAELTGTLNVDRSEWRASYAYSTSTLRYNGEGRITFSGEHTNLDIRFNNGDTFNFHVSGDLNMTSEMKQGSGLITITSGANTVIPLSLDVVVSNQGSMVINATSHEHNVKIEANLQGRNGASWAREGDSDLKIQGRIFKGGDVAVELHASHFIRLNEYSFNVTAADNVRLATYLRRGARSILFVKLQGYERPNAEDLVLDVKLLPSNANVKYHE